MSATDFAKIHKVVFAISCSQEMTIDTQTNRRDRVLDQSPRDGWQLITE